MLDAVRRHDPTCASIILTGFATVELAVSVIQEKGAFTCLQKDAFRPTDFPQIDRRSAGCMRHPRQVRRGNPRPADRRAHRPSNSPGAPERSTRFVERTLTLEDDAGWRSLLTELLWEAEIQARPCVSYVEAWACCAARRDYELVVVDLSLASSVVPGTNPDGYRLLAHTLRSGIPTVIVSGYADPADIERASRSTGYLPAWKSRMLNRKHSVGTLRKARQAWQLGSDLRHLTGREREVLASWPRGIKTKKLPEPCVLPPTL